MQVRSPVALVVALALLGCRGEGASAVAGAPSPVDSPALERVQVPERLGESGPRPVAPPAPEKPPQESDELGVGTRRATLLQRLGSCAERVYFVAGGFGAKTQEIFQPAPGRCVERFGARRFIVAGDRVEAVVPNLASAPEASPGQPSDRG